jgi:hypothetical protein
MAAVLAMAFNRGFDDPAATLWVIMLIIQSLPYAATVATAFISALSYGRKSSPDMMEPSSGEPLLPKAA